jgi:quercetin dioxygenase-like cupin family protein
MDNLDPVVASPNEYRLLLDTPEARVVEMRLPPGTSDQAHSHPHEYVYFIHGGKARVHVDGATIELDPPDGHIMDHEPWTHRVENIGDREILALIFELKQPPDAPAAALAPSRRLTSEP